MAKGKIAGITFATLIGVGIGTYLVLGFRARAKGWSYSPMIAKSFNLPLVDRQYVDLAEQQENLLSDKELKDSFR